MKRSTRKISKKSHNKSHKKTGGKRSYRRTYKRTGGRRSYKRTYKRTGGYSKKMTNKILAKKRVNSRLAAELTGTTKLKCPRGQIKRDGYIRKNGTVVAATCIKDLGKPGKTTFKKGETPILLKEGAMSKYGYHNLKNLTLEQRRKALMKAIRSVGYSTVMKRVNALRVLDKSTNKTIAKIALKDVNWMKNNREMLKRL